MKDKNQQNMANNIDTLFLHLKNDNKKSLLHQISIMPEMHEWRSKVYDRDNLICQFCHVKCRRRVLCEEYEKKLPIANAHHIISLLSLVKKFNISIYYMTAIFPEIWDISNGVTLCVDCHKKTPSYGKG